MAICLLFILIISSHLSFSQTKNNNMKLNLRKPNFQLLSNNFEDINLFNNKLFDNQEIIELEPDFVVTKISWTRKEEYKFNYLLGIFEGANDPSFSDGVPLAMIGEN